MFSLLNKYLVQQHSLALPGIGTFSFTNKPAESDFSNKQFLPPTQGIAFTAEKDTPARNLFTYISRQLGISEWEAVKSVNDFAYDLNARLRAGQSVKWEGVGSLTKENDGHLQFTPAMEQGGFFQPVVAEKVIREHAQHSMLVGDQERTNTQMAELLGEEAPARRSRWWILALILGLAGLTILLLHLAQNGWTLKALQNQ
jgi:nucleoid DNA-binding protein